MLITGVTGFINSTPALQFLKHGDCVYSIDNLRRNEINQLAENEPTNIPVGTKHRRENPDNTPLEIIELQPGGYLGEDDIVHIDDHYERQKN